MCYKFFTEIHSSSYKLPATSSVFQAEIVAIKMAAKYLCDLESVRYVRIFVDSQAAILALNNKKITSNDVLEAVQELNRAASCKTIIIHWTKAHIGTLGNERADQLAKEGCNDGSLVGSGFSKAELRNKVSDYLNNTWKKQFEQYNGARMGKLFYNGPDSIKAGYVMKLSRLQLARFIRIISGHNSLFYFRSKVDPDIKPTCRFCLEEDCLLYTSPSPRDS